MVRLPRSLLGSVLGWRERMLEDILRRASRYLEELGIEGCVVDVVLRGELRVAEAVLYQVGGEMGRWEKIASALAVLLATRGVVERVRSRLCGFRAGTAGAGPAAQRPAPG